MARPHESSEGQPGDDRRIELELKTVADVGLAASRMSWDRGGEIWKAWLPAPELPFEVFVNRLCLRCLSIAGVRKAPVANGVRSW